MILLHAAILDMQGSSKSRFHNIINLISNYEFCGVDTHDVGECNILSL